MFKKAPNLAWLLLFCELHLLFFINNGTDHLEVLAVYQKFIGWHLLDKRLHIFAWYVVRFWHQFEVTFLALHLWRSRVNITAKLRKLAAHVPSVDPLYWQIALHLDYVVELHFLELRCGKRLGLFIAETSWLSRLVRVSWVVAIFVRGVSVLAGSFGTTTHILPIFAVAVPLNSFVDVSLSHPSAIVDCMDGVA